MFVIINLKCDNSEDPDYLLSCVIFQRENEWVRHYLHTQALCEKEKWARKLSTDTLKPPPMNLLMKLYSSPHAKLFRL